jgi:hypothetical protein
MMLSRTYRLSSASAPAGVEKDPDNVLHWRTSPRRLEWEALRDTTLQISGELKTERPAGIQVAGYGGKGRAGTTVALLDLEAPYRTVYLPVLRDHLPDAYGTFDFPEPTQIKGQRDTTTAPPQALFAMNSDFIIAAARGAARAVLESSAKKDEDRIRAAYQRVLTREPDATELAAARQLLTDLDAEGTRDADLHRLATLTQALLGTAEFRYVW